MDMILILFNNANFLLAPLVYVIYNIDIGDFVIDTVAVFIVIGFTAATLVTFGRISRMYCKWIRMSL